MPSSVSGRAPQISSTSSGRAGAGAARLDPSHEPGARLDAQAAGPVGRRHLLLAERLDQPEPERTRAGADRDGVLADEELTGRQRTVGRRDGAELDPLALVRRPGSRRGGAGPDPAVHRHRRLGPVDVRVLDGDLGGEADAVLGLLAGLERADLETVEGGHEQAGTALGQPLQQRAGGVAGAHPLGHQPVRRPGVQLADDPEGRRAGHLVAGPQGVLDGGGAAPGGQHGEVQVHPAVGRDVERGLREQGAVRDHRAAVRCQRSQRLLELRVARVVGLEDGDAELRGALGDRRRREPASAAGRRVRSGHHADELVRRRRDRLEGREGRLRRPGEDDPH